MRCPRCKSPKTHKKGFIRGRQRYHCTKCSHKFTQHPERGVPLFIRRLAIDMYLEGLGFRSIGRIIGVSDVAVLNWVKGTAIALESLDRKFQQLPTHIRTMELDELCTYVGKKDAETLALVCAES
jgi:transposase-like protein